MIIDPWETQRLDAALVGNTIVASNPGARVMATSRGDVIEIEWLVKTSTLESKAFVAPMATVENIGEIKSIEIAAAPDQKSICLYVATQLYKRVSIAAVSVNSKDGKENPRVWVNKIKITWGEDILEDAIQIAGLA